eukprot:4076296-Lingulodinium_polyedra.AAC.1
MSRSFSSMRPVWVASSRSRGRRLCRSSTSKAARSSRAGPVARFGSGLVPCGRWPGAPGLSA